MPSQFINTEIIKLPDTIAQSTLNTLVAKDYCPHKQKQNARQTRRSVEHCTPHADGAWLNELGWSQ